MCTLNSQFDRWRLKLFREHDEENVYAQSGTRMTERKTFARATKPPLEVSLNF